VKHVREVEGSVERLREVEGVEEVEGWRKT
jgi:hypothetical protein